jgi:hypothetical protein
VPVVDAAWPWAVLVGLGIYHGINPAMGWLFAVALGLHRESRAVVLASLVPIALGHALSIAIVVAVVVALGLVVEHGLLQALAGGALVLWALYHLAYGARHRTRVGMRAGFAGLVLWSFLMAGAHGAGLMLIPALIPLCLSGNAAGEIARAGSLPLSLAAVGVHTAAMLAVTGAIALLVYEWVGVAFLRRGWINVDLIWTGALLATGIGLLGL